MKQTLICGTRHRTAGTRKIITSRRNGQSVNKFRLDRKMSLYKDCAWWKNFDFIFEFSVKSYVTNTINLSRAKILLPNVIAKLYCWNFDGEFRDGRSGTQNKQAQHPQSCIIVRTSKRGGEEVTLLTGIPEMLGTNLGRVDGYFVSILRFCKLHSSRKCWKIISIRTRPLDAVQSELPCWEINHTKIKKLRFVILKTSSTTNR
jgi:hypothetical protein